MIPALSYEGLCSFVRHGQLENNTTFLFIVFFEAAETLFLCQDTDPTAAAAELILRPSLRLLPQTKQGRARRLD